MIDATQIILGTIALLIPAVFASRTLILARRWPIHSRASLFTSALDTLLVLMLAHALLAWWTLPAFLWMLPVALAAAGSAGAVLRWAHLPLLVGRRTTREVILTVTHVLVVGGLLVLILVG